MYKTIEKYWGVEEWIQVTKDYAFKKLKIFEGHILLNHYHAIKEETFYVASGHGVIIINGKRNTAWLGDTFHISPGTRHQIEAIEEMIILEASTPQLEDSVREELKCL